MRNLLSTLWWGVLFGSPFIVMCLVIWVVYDV